MGRWRPLELVSLAGLSWFLAVQAGAAPGVWRTALVDPSGMRIEAHSEPGSGPEGVGGSQPAGSGIIWHLIDPASITESVCVADTTDETWVGHNLNFERLSYLQTTGNGVPIYEVTVQGESPTTVAVASAEDVSLGVLLTVGTPGTVVRGFDQDSGPTPLWTYTFPAQYTSAGFRGVDVSADGSIAVAVAYSPGTAQSLVVILDTVDGLELNNQSYSGFSSGIELSDDGSRAVLTQGNVARIVETPSLSDLHSFSVSGGGGFHRISRDGTTVAAGGFNLKVHRDDGGVWTQILIFSQPNNWFGAGLALSADGDTLLVVTYNYATGYVDLTYRVMDLANQMIAAQITTNGSGALQDTVAGAQASADGQVFAVASWGTQDNVHPEVQVFDRDLSLIASIDTPGSPFSIDMTRDGRFVVVGSKAIHANTTGSGSNTYALGVEPPCPWDCDGSNDDNANVADLLALLAQYDANSPVGCTGGTCDFNGDGCVDVVDLLKLLAHYTFDPAGIGCPQ